MTALELAEIARLEEQRQARGTADVADTHELIAGGVMGKGPRGSWLNSAVGLGFDGPVDRGVVDRVVDWYERDRIEPRIEVAPYAHESLVRHLSAAGFVLRVFESVFFRQLDPAEHVVPLRASTVDGLAVRRVDPADRAAAVLCATVVARGFTAEGQAVRPEDIETWERCTRHARTTVFGAFAGDECIGAGSVEVAGEISALFGLSVDASFRRRGVQQALIAARLRWASERGARFATISARPFTGTVRNARRMGFQVAYTKVTLVRPGPGLTAVVC